MQPLVAMSGISKAFSGVSALGGASLEIAPGEVHGLIGQNGAGKSTMIKVLTGVYRRDAGEVSFAGRPLAVSAPREAQEAGISTIHQELNLVPLRSVTENVTMGYEPRRWGLIDWRAAHARTREILARFGIAIDVRAPLGEYSTAIQQLVAIARAVSLNARLVIMDEPTSSLDDREAEVLFGVVRGLRDDGVSVLYVSHFLDELFAICDRVTVMRDGRTVAVRAVAETSKVALIADMLGRPVAEIEAAGMTELGGGSARHGEMLLEAEAIASARNLRAVDLTVSRGEIVGVGGLLGSGRTETARAVFGLDPLTEGTIRVGGRPGPASPAAAIAAGIGFLTEDRKAEGIVPDMSVRENLTLALLPRLTRRGAVRRGDERALVERYVRELGIKIAHIDQPIRQLSGGNQQKVLLARWLATEPDLLLLDEPTRGVDVGAKREIQAIIRRFVDAGHGVLLISSEFEELVEGADRVIVLRDGRSVAVLANPGLTEDALIGAIAHHDAAPA
jgi:monosaccharide-transporting ATPase